MFRLDCDRTGKQRLAGQRNAKVGFTAPSRAQKRSSPWFLVASGAAYTHEWHLRLSDIILGNEVRSHQSKTLRNLGNAVQLESGNLGGDKRRRAKSEARYFAIIVKGKRSPGGSICWLQMRTTYNPERE